jgi:glycosyltransferase involved in cell wall biosynthesis
VVPTPPGHQHSAEGGAEAAQRAAEVAAARWEPDKPQRSTGTDVLHLMFGGLGGQFSVVSQLSQRLRARGLRSSACLYAPAGEFLDDGSTDAFDEVVRVVKARRFDPAGARAIRAQLNEARPRAVLWHVPYAPGAVRDVRRRGPCEAVILVEHSPAELRRRIDDVRSFRALRVADAVVFQSQVEYAKHPLRRLPLRLLDPPLFIPNGIDLERYAPTVRRTGADGAVHVGMITRMVGQKDFDSLIRAVALLDGTDVPPFRVTLAGDGPDRAALERLVDQTGVGHLVDFVGRVRADEVVDLLRDLDVFVHATFGESVGMALLEAYGAGLPIVTTDVSGVNNMVRHGVDGLLVPAGDPAALARQLERLLRDPAERASLGAAARARARRDFGIELMADRYLAALARVDPAGPWMAGS